jgi:hypothetical protein
MITRIRLLICVLLGSLTSDLAVGQTWRGQDIEASVSNRANTSSLVIECISNGSIFLRIQFRAYTNIRMNEDAVLRIGAKKFPVRVDVSSEHIFLSDTPKTGISAELIAALKGGGVLVAEGPAVRHLPEAQRSFPLDGGAKFIEEVQSGCGR